MASPATYMLDGFNSKDPRFVNWAPTGAYGWQVGWALVFWATRCLGQCKTEKGPGLAYFVIGHQQEPMVVAGLWGHKWSVGRERAGLLFCKGGAMCMKALKLYKIGSLRNWGQGFLQNESPAL